jgi:hypothetical protein
MLKPFAHDTIREDIKGKLFFAIKVGCPCDTKITGSYGINHIFAGFGNFTEKMHEIAADILVTQMLTKINLKFCLACYTGHASSEITEMRVLPAQDT